MPGFRGGGQGENTTGNQTENYRCQLPLASVFFDGRAAAAAGLETRRLMTEAEMTGYGGKIMADHQIEGIVTGVVLGGLVGAALGILFAPQSGRKTRKEICEKTGELLTEAKSEYKSALKKSGKAYESAVKQLKHLKSSAKGKAGKVGDKIEELTEMGREALHS